MNLLAVALLALGILLAVAALAVALDAALR